MSGTATQDLPARQGQGWDVEEERRLYDAFAGGEPFAHIAEKHNRTRGAVRSHLRKLGMIDDNNIPVDPCPAFAPTDAARKRGEKKTTRVAGKAERAALEKKEASADKRGTELNPRFAEALRLMTDGDRSLFITGRAGTGKSTLLRHFRRHSTKNIVVLAPTGIAALNVGGQTIHHFFHFSIDVTPQKVAGQKKPRNPKLYKKLETMVIDEISMVRADILDCVETFLRMHGPYPGQPFGGVQMVFIGDLYQLPPVVGAQDRAIFSGHYQTPYFFSAHCMRDFVMPMIELEKVYRQKDGDFVALLNRVRDDTITPQDIALLNTRLSTVALDDERFSISLTTTNQRADTINAEHLAALRGRAYSKPASLTGDFGREYFPAAPDLAFKTGAQIMLLTNDREGRWVNGSIGEIDAVKTDVDGREYVAVSLQDSDEPVAVYPHKWEVYRFAVEDNQIESEAVGTFEQYPFRLAWAVTIHKSQGKTFERVTIDLGSGAFAGGQVYVALSRCTSFEGITLRTPIQRRHIRTDPLVRQFMESNVLKLSALPGSVELIEDAIRESAMLDIVYVKNDGEKTERRVMPRALGHHRYQERPFLGLKAFSLVDQQELLFSLDRILEIRKTA
jgi:ATP-dependent DNA helicase PIF1